MLPVAVLAGRVRQTLSVSTSAAVTGALKGGKYAVWSAVAVNLKVAQTTGEADDVTTSNGYEIPANGPKEFIDVPEGWFIGAIAGGAGTLNYHHVGT